MERVTEVERRGGVPSDVYRLSSDALLYVPVVPEWELQADQLRYEGRRPAPTRKAKLRSDDIG